MDYLPARSCKVIQRFNGYKFAVIQALEPIALGMPRTLFLLSPSKVKGGNYSTISRIRSHLVKHGHTCMLWDTGELEKNSNANEILKKHQVDLIIGIHAYRTGKIMKDCDVPYILILGGTDVNEFWKDKHCMFVMTTAVCRARYVVSFSESLQKKALALWPNLCQKQLTVITQAVITKPSKFSLCGYLQEHHAIEDGEDRHIFLLVGSVRPVKNPIYLMDTLSNLHKENKKILFVIIGPVADEEYFKRDFQPALQRCEGVIHIPGLPFEDTHTAMLQCFALVNSSESEGMSLAILEAMQLKTVVLVRDIPGNSTLVQDGHNGLLFSTPQEFCEKAQQILSDQACRNRLVTNAAEHATVHHSIKQEEGAYLTIVENSLADNTATPDLTNGYS